MKPWWILIVALMAAGCAEDTPPAAEVRQQFDREFSGQDRAVPYNHPEEPILPPGGRP